jgi:hypothetical protein
MAVQPFMSKNAAQIRDILREQFDAESSRASDPSVAALFLELARTADDIPDVLADAYSELFDNLYSSEIEMKMTWQMGIQLAEKRHGLRREIHFQSKRGRVAATVHAGGFFRQKLPMVCHTASRTIRAPITISVHSPMRFIVEPRICWPLTSRSRRHLGDGEKPC